MRQLWKVIRQRSRSAGPLEDAFRVRRRTGRLGNALGALFGRTQGCSCLLCVHHRAAGTYPLAGVTPR